MSAAQAHSPVSGMRMSRRRRLVLWLLTGAGGLAVWAVLLHWQPLPGAEHSICLFRRLTGISCPGCGLTRAVALLAQGELWLGFRMHPMAPLLAVEATLGWLCWGYLGLRGRTLSWGRWPQRWIATHTAALFLLWLARLATGTLPPG